MSSPTHALLTTAPPELVAGAVAEPALVGRLDGWTVVGLSPHITSFPTETATRISKATQHRVLGVLDLGSTIAVCTAVNTSSATMMWSAGWQPPTGSGLTRFQKQWAANAGQLAAQLGRPELTPQLADTLILDPRPEVWPDLSTRVLLGVVDLLGIPREALGVSAVDPGPLTDVVRAEPAAKRGLFRRR
ncbi:hypothetical protein GCM10022415_16350 [Knoellia locipacati]|uniref:Uncharacterized protein n=1 Tax=Knoellia locipacati TaxID=882824 RepID=A0A512T087_9MICO|nr:hypothetical protein [Knoellia locipacati]GEQ13584.1 hypothetical protein KLO01_16310 [Knoellia locipacati]